jgi:hypothetical protein
MIAVQALEKRTAELQQTKAQLTALESQVEELKVRRSQPIQITAEQRGY